MNIHRNLYDYPSLDPDQDETWAGLGRESDQRPPDYGAPTRNGTIVSILAIGVLLLIGIVLAT